MDFHEDAVIALVAAMVRQAAIDYHRGWRGDQLGTLDPLPFLEAIGMADRAGDIATAMGGYVRPQLDLAYHRAVVAARCPVGPGGWRPRRGQGDYQR